jgi:hypothetical protein
VFQSYADTFSSTNNDTNKNKQQQRIRCQLLSPHIALEREREQLWQCYKIGDDGKLQWECCGAQIIITTPQRLIEHLYYVDVHNQLFGSDEEKATLHPSSLDLTHLRYVLNHLL